MRFLAVLCAALLFVAPSFARLGTVRTLSAQMFEGNVRFTPEQVIVANATRGTITGIQLTNIERISFPTNSLAQSLEDFGSEPVPAPWRETDIGARLIAGSTRYQGQVFAVRSSGINIGGEADSFHYVFKPVRGDSEIVAEVVSIQYTHPYAKAGLMMRETLNEYSPNVMVALTAQRGAALQFRSSERANTETSATRAFFAPHWLKLRRHGSEFSAFTSRNGRIWSLLERASVSMSETFYVGMAVASAREAVLNWTTFARVREAPRLLNDNFTPEVELISGSVITGRPEEANENQILFGGLPKVFRVPTERVARITYQPLSGELAWKTRVSRPGAWVTSGDFFEGEFRGIEGPKLTISSVLYGLRTFDIDDEILAVVLHPRKVRNALFELKTPDGATLYLSGVALGDGDLRVQEPAVGEVHIPAFEILELRRR